MLEEGQCEPEYRYLMILGRYSPSATAKMVQAVRTHYDQERYRFDDKATSVTEDFLSFMASFRGVVLQTCYCHADVERGQSYDMVFAMQQPDRFENTRAVAHYNVIWGKAASAGLAHGWHQAAFFEFPEGVPELIASLPEDNFGAKPLVAICDSANQEAITRDWKW
jgi:hypothetical protein